MSHEYIEFEHAFVRRHGRFVESDLERDDVRILPRRLRRQLARRWADRRIPIVLPLIALERFVAELEAERDRRAEARAHR